MSNIITIKHGNNPPITGNLENYELGYAKNNKGLYIKYVPNRYGVRRLE